MADFEQTIDPATGLGALRLGASQEEVLDLLGEPSRRGSLDYEDGSTIRMWEFESQALSLSFAENDEYRLGSITTGHDNATLSGHNIIGETEEAFLKHDFGPLGAPELEDDGGDAGKDYAWSEANLSCWIADGHVISVCIMPRYDETGDIPIWPS